MKKIKSLFVALVASFGLAHNKHWGLVQSEVPLDDLFRC